jgi:hypothetical protein
VAARGDQGSVSDTDREKLGRLVRETWVTWAKRQRHPKPSWLIGWDYLDADQREVDMLIGEAVAEAERKRMVTLPEHELSAEAIAAVENVMRERFEQTVIKTADEVMASRLAELEAAVRAEERERLARLAERQAALPAWAAIVSGSSALRLFAQLIREDGEPS